MLTRAKHKQGEGTLKTFNLEIVVHLEGIKGMKRTSMMNRRKTSIWSSIACHIWSSESMGTTRR
jgi:hypothetical protein